MAGPGFQPPAARPSARPVRRTRVRSCRAAPDPAGGGDAEAAALIGAAIVALFLVLAIFAPLIAPYGFDQVESGGTRFPKQGGARPRPTCSGPPSSPPTCSRG